MSALYNLQFIDYQQVVKKMVRKLYREVDHILKPALVAGFTFFGFFSPEHIID
jgi:hypothetical protein